MARPKKGTVTIPAYRLHRASGRAIVTIAGEVHYLGKHDSAESKSAYQKMIGEWLARGRQQPTTSRGLTISEVIAGFYVYAQGYYHNAKSINSFKLALGTLREAYGPEPAAAFDTFHLRAYRETLLNKFLPERFGVGIRYSRNHINSCVLRLLAVFKWAEGMNMVPGGTYAALKLVPLLKKNRSQARETEPVPPAREQDIQAVLPLVRSPIRAMIELQYWCGCRPGEACIMRACDIDMSDPDAWIYRPTSHKMEYKEKDRLVWLGRPAQEVIRPFFKPDVTAFLFSPRDSWPEGWFMQRREHLQDVLDAGASIGETFGTREVAERLKIGVATVRAHLFDLRAAGVIRRVRVHAAKQFGVGTSSARYSLVPGPHDLTQTPRVSFHSSMRPAKTRPGLHEHYSAASYAGAIKYAINRANAKTMRLHPDTPADKLVEHWTPHQLRHNFATMVKAKSDGNTARILLGHGDEKVTAIYAREDYEKARRFVAQLG